MYWYLIGLAEGVVNFGFLMYRRVVGATTMAIDWPCYYCDFSGKGDGFFCLVRLEVRVVI